MIRKRGFCGKTGTLECSLTTACNLACSYCDQGEHQPRSMPWEVLRSEIDGFLASDFDTRTLAMTGGEPLMEWPLIRRAVEYVRQSALKGKPLSISLTTNGLLLDSKKVRFLVDNHVDVQVSLDGVREAHELRAPDTWDRIDRLLVRLRRDHLSWFRKRLSIGITLTSANLRFLDQTIEYLLGLGVENIRLAPLLTHDEGWGREAENELESQMGTVFDLCLKHHRRTGTMPFELFRRPTNPPEPRTDRPVCRVNAPESLAVGVDGSVSGCPLLLPQEVGGTRSAPVLGEWIVQSKWPGLRRDRFSSWGHCRDCEFVDECLVCPVASANIPGNTDPHRVPDFNCAFNRIVGRYRRLFPPVFGPEDHLIGNDPLPTAMTELATALRLG